MGGGPSLGRLFLFCCTAWNIMVAGPRAAILEEEEEGSGIRMDPDAFGAAPPAPDGNVIRHNSNFYLVSVTIILGFLSSLVNDTLGTIFTGDHHGPGEAGQLPAVQCSKEELPGRPAPRQSPGSATPKRVPELQAIL